MAKPLVRDSKVHCSNIKIDTPEWLAFLDSINSFYYSHPFLTFGVRRNSRKYWQAYKRKNGILQQKYLGVNHRVTKQLLDLTAEQFNDLSNSGLIPKHGCIPEFGTEASKLHFEDRTLGVVTVVKWTDGSRFIDVEDLLALGLKMGDR